MGLKKIWSVSVYMHFMSSLRKSRVAKVSIASILMLCLGLFVAAYTLPDAVVAITCSTSYAGAPASVITLMTTVVGIVVAVVFIMILLKSRN